MTAWPARSWDFCQSFQERDALFLPGLLNSSDVNWELLVTCLLVYSVGINATQTEAEIRNRKKRSNPGGSL